MAEARAQIPTTTEHGEAWIDSLKVDYTLERPVETADPVPLVIMPGFFGFEESYRGLAKVAAGRGKPTVTYTPERGSWRHAFSLDQLVHPEKLPAQAAAGLLRALNKDHGYEASDVAPHSLSGQTLAALDDQALQYIRQAHLLAPAGITNHSLVDLTLRVPRLLNEEIRQEFNVKTMPFIFNPKALIQAAVYLKYPWRIPSEGMSVSSCRIHDDLERIQKSGVAVTATWFVRDPLFNAEDGHRWTSWLLPGGHSEIFADLTAGHAAPITRAQALGDYLVQRSLELG